jgi:hypothetical protein
MTLVGSTVNRKGHRRRRTKVSNPVNGSKTNHCPSIRAGSVSPDLNS